jgi:hypothetical protein
LEKTLGMKIMFQTDQWESFLPWTHSGRSHEHETLGTKRKRSVTPDHGTDHEKPANRCRAEFRWTLIAKMAHAAIVHP